MRNLNFPDYYNNFFYLLRIRTYDIIFNSKHLKFREQDYIFFNPNNLLIEMTSIFPIKSFPVVPHINRYRLEYDEKKDKHQHQLINLNDQSIKSYENFQELKNEILKIVNNKFEELKIVNNLDDIGEEEEDDLIKGRQWWKRMENYHYFNCKRFLRGIILLNFTDIFKIGIFIFINICVNYFFLKNYLIFEVVKEIPFWSFLIIFGYFISNISIIILWFENLGGKFKLFER